MTARRVPGSGPCPHPTNRTPLVERLDLRTNVEVRAAALGMRAAGASRDVVAQVLGLGPERIDQIEETPRPERVRSTAAWIVATLRTCPGCGRDEPRLQAKGNAGAVPVGEYVCDPCRRSQHAATAEQRETLLRRYAVKLDGVPTVREAAELLGIGRSVAGDLVLAMFGRDDRPLGPHRHERRPLPDAFRRDCTARLLGLPVDTRRRA